MNHLMRRRESALESWAVKWARLRGIVVAKLKELVGVPDRVFFVPGGSPIIVEFKAKNEIPEALQTWYLKTLKKHGYRIYTCDTKERFLEIMKEYEKCRSVTSVKKTASVRVRTR